MDLALRDLASIDRDVARAADALLRWRAKLERDPESAKDEDPLERFRAVAGQSAYDALTARTESSVDDPLRQGLVRWVYALTQARILRPVDAALAQALGEESAHALCVVPQMTSWREAWRQVVTARERGTASTWLSAAAERGPAVAALVRERGARRFEVARRLGLEHPAQLATSTPHARLTAAAEELLRSTSELWIHVWRAARARSGLAGVTLSPVDAIAVAVARDATEGWPAQLDTRWLGELFGDLARGLRLDVAMPTALGAASFALAMVRFGCAVREGAVRALPFALGRDPFPVDSHRFGLLLGTLPATVQFQRRALGLSARVAAAQARSLALSALFEARTTAVRFLLCDEANPRANQRFEELSVSLFGAPLDASFGGAWPVPGAEGERLEALLGVQPELAWMVGRFDEDWFRNPHAIAHLRARASTAARDPGLPALDTEAATRCLARAFEEALG